MYPSNCIEKLSQILEGPSSLSFIAGDQGSGKSHFSRFLSNSIISRHGLVYYVDLDCGQPEMSLPGVVSLTACRSFLLSAPEQQLFRPDQRMFFAGGLRTDRLTYFQAVLRILDSIPRDACAVINSNGYLWGEAGIGFQRDLITLLKPDHVFFLHSGGGPEILTESQLNVEISRLPSLAPPASQKVKRTLRIAGYFLRGKPPMIVQQPVTVPVRSVRFGLPLDEFFDYFEVPSIFSGSLVYLCIDERQFRPIQKLVTIVKQISAVQVKGFGFVKAIDLEHKVIYIVTPVDVSDINLLCYIPLDIPAIFYGESPCCQHTYIDLREVVI
jgi:polynucleotide 5'-hydroxyl-kinase GRC3/NOL9